MFTLQYKMSGYTRSHYTNPHYSYHSLSTDTHPYRKTSNPLSDTDLAKLTAEIERGVHRCVVLIERNLSSEQFIKLMLSCTAMNSNVEEIDVSNNQIRGNAIRDLIHTLSKNNKVRKLNLSYNEINDDAIEFFLKILQNNFTITNINLFKNPIIVQNLAKLSPFLDKNMEIGKELVKSNFYSAILAKLDELRLARPLVNIILDYYNEATVSEAREVISKTLYRPSSHLRTGTVEYFPTGIPPSALLFSYPQQVKDKNGYIHAEFTAVTKSESHSISIRSISQDEASGIESHANLTKKDKKRCTCVIL